MESRAPHHDGPRGAARTAAAVGGTRGRVLTGILNRGPVTVAELAGPLGLTAAGVRRHVDALVAEGLVRQARRAPSRPGRGRPARAYAVTPAGRREFGHGYEELAELALARLRVEGGSDALRALADARARAIVGGIPPADGSRASIEDTARALAEAFDAHGHVATATIGRGGVRICHHHCPVSHVAARYPELCEAEHTMIAELTGTHARPSASIATGDATCTTIIPLAPHLKTPDERSGHDAGDREA